MYVQDKFETYNFQHKKLEMKFEKLKMFMLMKRVKYFQEE